MRPTEVLADLLVLASERDRLVDTDRLLRELVGPDVVNEAHAEWTDRLREGVAHGDHGVIAPGHDVASDPDVFDLTRRLRATTPGRRR